MKLTIDMLAERINNAAAEFHVGKLQALRATLHGRRARTTKVFSKSTVFPTYAFHDGGRKELQFNVGYETRDDGLWWRHGVAFSFEPGQSLPDPTLLLPKVDCFNEWIRANGNGIQDFKMWHWDGQSPSADRPPAEISDDIARTGGVCIYGQ